MFFRFNGFNRVQIYNNARFSVKRIVQTYKSEGGTGFTNYSSSELSLCQES